MIVPQTFGGHQSRQQFHGFRRDVGQALDYLLQGADVESLG
jgi:hypothetical protein